MKKPLSIQPNRCIQLKQVVISSEQELTLRYAFAAYSFVLFGMPVGDYSLTEFADKIEAVYDGSVPQTSAILRTLVEVQFQTDNPPAKLAA